MSAPTLLPVEPVEVETPENAVTLPRAEEWWCPVSQSTTCTATAEQQKGCSAC